MILEDKYDVIVVGAGHAGCEAAHAAATLGSKVLLVHRIWKLLQECHATQQWVVWQKVK